MGPRVAALLEARSRHRGCMGGGVPPGINMGPGLGDSKPAIEELDALKADSQIGGLPEGDDVRLPGLRAVRPLPDRSDLSHELPEGPAQRAVWRNLGGGM